MHTSVDFMKILEEPANAFSINDKLLEEIISRNPNLKNICNLLQQGANPNTDYKDDYTIFEIATEQTYPDNPDIFYTILHLLIDAGAKVSSSQAFYNAISTADKKLVKLLLENKADPNVSDSEESRTALHYAAIFCDLTSAMLLVKYQAQINAKDMDGNTPLHLAISQEEKDEPECFIEFLLKKGGDINAQNHEGEAPLHLAVRKGLYTVIDLLVHYGANLCARNNTGKTLADFAKEYLIKDEDEAYYCIGLLSKEENLLHKLFRENNKYILYQLCSAYLADYETEKDRVKILGILKKAAKAKQNGQVEEVVRLFSIFGRDHNPYSLLETQFENISTNFENNLWLTFFVQKPFILNREMMELRCPKIIAAMAEEKTDDRAKFQKT